MNKKGLALNFVQSFLPTSHGVAPKARPALLSFGCADTLTDSLSAITEL